MIHIPVRFPFHELGVYLTTTANSVIRQHHLDGRSAVCSSFVGLFCWLQGRWRQLAVENIFTGGFRLRCLFVFVGGCLLDLLLLLLLFSWAPGARRGTAGRGATIDQKTDVRRLKI